MDATKGTRKSASLMASLAVVVLTLAVSFQGTAFCVGTDGSVTMFASGSECHCAMHEHSGTVCSHSHGNSTVLGSGCNCLDVAFELSPAVVDGGSRTILKPVSGGGTGTALSVEPWMLRGAMAALPQGLPGVLRGERPVLLHLQTTVLLI